MLKFESLGLYRGAIGIPEYYNYFLDHLRQVDIRSGKFFFAMPLKRVGCNKLIREPFCSQVVYNEFFPITYNMILLILLPMSCISMMILFRVPAWSGFSSGCAGSSHIS